ncbi:hypothetical protein Afil01_05720 [Actinorhabdospora filicis]|uniref:Winged helix DNA-binding domain-containing protein n=1 Tax=Actinorhabdospora filicis TaxID=1785913 RepID=A0A9W6SGV4_9ACTN|nr:winged helix DNA-binding domain-containing protein [Actinorhabdospora filicis]GLZ75765.1 hypothetical protein Afil01_05720 [Actinorhabdospora filicis]
MATADVIPLPATRAFSLRRQGLSGPGFATVVDAVRGTGGVYSSSPTCHLSLAARVTGFTIDDLEDELYETRRLVRLRAQRQMAYVQPVEDLPWILAAAEPGRRGRASALRQLNATYTDYERMAHKVETAMAGHEPMTLAAIKEAAPDVDDARLVVALMTRETRLVRTRPRGTWRSDSYGYARWGDWIGEAVSTVDTGEARAALARRYFTALGPATADDLRWWTGWTAGETKAVLFALRDELTEIRLGYEAPDDEVPAHVLTADLDELRASTVDPGVRLLPVWDAYPMGYKDRRRVVPPALHPRVIDPVGNATSMVLVDGEAAGVWQAGYDRLPGALVVSVALFSGAAGDRRGEIEAEAERLARSVGAADVDVEWAAERGALADGVRNTFMSPVSLGVER